MPTVAFLLSEKNGSWGKAQQIPGLATLAGRDGDAEISCRGLPGVGILPGRGVLRVHASHAFVAQETKGAWGKPTQIPHLAAMDTARAGMANLVSCPSVGNCTVAGQYGTGSNDNPVPHEFVASEAGGHWHDAIPVPGLDALANVAGGGEAERYLAVVRIRRQLRPRRELLDGTVVERGPPGQRQARDLRRDLASTRPATQFGPLARLGLDWPAGQQPGAGGPFVAGEVGGTWGDATAPAIPGLTSSGEATVNSVACPAAGDCVAGGAYSVSASSSGPGRAVLRHPAGHRMVGADHEFHVRRRGPRVLVGRQLHGGRRPTPRASPPSSARKAACGRRRPNCRGPVAWPTRARRPRCRRSLNLACPSAGNCSVIGIYGYGQRREPDGHARASSPVK